MSANSSANFMATSPFPIAAPRDLLAKAKREIDRLESEANGDWDKPNPTAIADLTINAAWSLWHVTDWIGHAALHVVQAVVPTKMGKPARKRADAFQRRLRAKSHDLRICWALAIRFKHFEVESEARDVLDAPASISLRPSMGVLNYSLGEVDSIPAISSVAPPARLEELAFSWKPVGSIAAPGKSTLPTLHPKVTYRKKRLRVVDVYRRAHDYLDQLLARHGL